MTQRSTRIRIPRTTKSAVLAALGEMTDQDPAASTPVRGVLLQAFESAFEALLAAPRDGATAVIDLSDDELQAVRVAIPACLEKVEAWEMHALTAHSPEELAREQPVLEAALDAAEPV